MNNREMMADGKWIDQNGKQHEVYADNDGGLWFYDENGKVVTVDD